MDILAGAVIVTVGLWFIYAALLEIRNQLYEILHALKDIRRIVRDEQEERARERRRARRS